MKLRVGWLLLVVSAIIIPTFGRAWRAQHEISLRSSGMTPIELSARRCGMHFGMPEHGASKWRSTTANGSFGCGFETTEKVLTGMFLAQGRGPVTTVCQACTSGSKLLEASSLSGVNPIPALRSSRPFLGRLRTLSRPVQPSNHSDTVVFTSPASTRQCLGCGRRRPARILAAYDSQTPSADDKAETVIDDRRG